MRTLNSFDEGLDVVNADSVRTRDDLTSEIASERELVGFDSGSRPAPHQDFG